VAKTTGAMAVAGGKRHAARTGRIPLDDDDVSRDDDDAGVRRVK